MDIPYEFKQFAKQNRERRFGSKGMKPAKEGRQEREEDSSEAQGQFHITALTLPSTATNMSVQQPDPCF